MIEMYRNRRILIKLRTIITHFDPIYVSILYSTYQFILHFYSTRLVKYYRDNTTTCRQTIYDEIRDSFNFVCQ